MCRSYSLLGSTASYFNSILSGELFISFLYANIETILCLDYMWKSP